MPAEMLRAAITTIWILLWSFSDYGLWSQLKFRNVYSNSLMCAPPHPEQLQLLVLFWPDKTAYVITAPFTEMMSLSLLATILPVCRYAWALGTESARAAMAAKSTKRASEGVSEDAIGKFVRERREVSERRRLLAVLWSICGQRNYPRWPSTIERSHSNSNSIQPLFRL